MGEAPYPDRQGRPSAVGHPAEHLSQQQQQYVTQHMGDSGGLVQGQLNFAGGSDLPLAAASDSRHAGALAPPHFAPPIAVRTSGQQLAAQPLPMYMLQPQQQQQAFLWDTWQQQQQQLMLQQQQLTHLQQYQQAAALQQQQLQQQQLQQQQLQQQQQQLQQQQQQLQQQEQLQQPEAVATDESLPAAAVTTQLHQQQPAARPPQARGSKQARSSSLQPHHHHHQLSRRGSDGTAAGPPGAGSSAVHDDSDAGDHGGLTVMQRYHMKRKQNVQKMEQDVAHKVSSRNGSGVCRDAAVLVGPCRRPAKQSSSSFCIRH